MPDETRLSQYYLYFAFRLILIIVCTFAKPSHKKCIKCMLMATSLAHLMPEQTCLFWRICIGLYNYFAALFKQSFEENSSTSATQF